MTITTIGLAVVAFVLVSIDSNPLSVSADFSAGFPLALSLMDMAFTYNDYWPVDYQLRYAIMWTLIFGVATVAVFLSVYEFGLTYVGNRGASIAAFLLAVGLHFGSAVLYAWIR
ncbi:hypothetical protein C463_08346 [Halorubrum californiense DSM 19288]|uniref:Uncharacterized protein n=1 Tax=Halorubrum californiense DSM 19288 TaxID=1227465 RepID=M0EBS0_9EURY|nr:hypothetical protein [Halorubrum californiense]ELZ44468.1 hypothetical protein C463_08346 [Halorubrum californiense DSM 19288]